MQELPADQPQEQADRQAIHPRRRFLLTKAELNTLNERLRTLQMKNGMGIPKGVDPMHPQRISRRAMRGR